MRLALLCCFVIASSGPAVADAPVLDPSKREAATKLVADGSAKLEHQDFAGALEMYREAYRIYPSPKLHFNMALALQALHRNAEAADELAQFMDAATDAPADARAQASKMLAELDQKVGKLVVVSKVAGAKLSIDDQAAGALPITRRLAAGTHALHAIADGHKPWDERVTITAGEATRKTIDLEAIDLQVKTVRDRPVEPVEPGKPTEPGKPAEHGSILETWWFWTAVGVVAIGSGVITYEATRTAGPPASELGTFKPIL